MRAVRRRLTVKHLELHVRAGGRRLQRRAPLRVVAALAARTVLERHTPARRQAADAALAWESERSVWTRGGSVCARVGSVWTRVGSVWARVGSV